MPRRASAGRGGERGGGWADLEEGARDGDKSLVWVARVRDQRGRRDLRQGKARRRTSMGRIVTASPRLGAATGRGRRAVRLP